MFWKLCVQSGLDQIITMMIYISRLRMKKRSIQCSWKISAHTFLTGEQQQEVDLTKFASVLVSWCSLLRASPEGRGKMRLFILEGSLNVWLIFSI